MDAFAPFAPITRRPTRGGIEKDMFSRKYRAAHTFRPGEVAKVKAIASRRDRRGTRTALRALAA